MKKVFNFVTKRKNSSASQDPAHDGLEGSSLGRNSIGSSATSSVFQLGQARPNPDPNSSPGNIKF